MPSTRVLGGACWASQGIALLLGVTQYIQLSAARCGRGWHPGLGRAAVALGFRQRSCRGGREDSGVRVLKLESNVNIRRL